MPDMARLAEHWGEVEHWREEGWTVLKDCYQARCRCGWRGIVRPHQELAGLDGDAHASGPVDDDGNPTRTTPTNQREAPMAEPTVLHRCQVTTWDAGITTLCEKPAAIYKAKRGDKTYKLCPHHFIGFASDLDPIASDDTTGGAANG